MKCQMCERQTRRRGRSLTCSPECETAYRICKIRRKRSKGEGDYKGGGGNSAPVASIIHTPKWDLQSW